jgi:ComF family protein
MGIFDLIFPVKCLECGKPGRYVCDNCLKKVEQVKQTRTPNFDRVFSVWRYDGVIRKAILALKYKFALDIAKELADRFVESYQKFSLPVLDKAVLVPVPIHWRRENWRGFNQSEEVGKLIAQKFGWQFEPNLLTKKKSTISQTELSRANRFLSPHNSFALSPDYSLVPTNFRVGQAPLIAQCLVLFDDVFTTGATLSEAAKVLQIAGYRNVWGMTLTR